MPLRVYCRFKEKNMKTHEYFMRRCYDLAVSAGKKGYDTFGALLVNDGNVVAEAENTADYQKGLFGHAEFNLVHMLANRFSDQMLSESTLYTSCAPCNRCMMAIASLGIKRVVYGVGYQQFARLLPFVPHTPDYENLLAQMDVELHLEGPVLEEDGMHVFEWWGGEHRPLEELLKESEDMRKANEH